MKVHHYSYTVRIIFHHILNILILRFVSVSNEFDFFLWKWRTIWFLSLNCWTCISNAEARNNNSDVKFSTINQNWIAFWMNGRTEINRDFHLKSADINWWEKQVNHKQRIIFWRRRRRKKITKPKKNENPFISLRNYNV